MVVERARGGHGVGRDLSSPRSCALLRQRPECRILNMLDEPSMMTSPTPGAPLLTVSSPLVIVTPADVMSTVPESLARFAASRKVMLSNPMKLPPPEADE